MEKKLWQKRGQGHRARLRDRFLTNGLEGFTDTEILELLLSFGTPRTDCKGPARELLQRYGTFSKVLEASISSLQEVAGLGPKNCFALHFVHAVARYYLKERLVEKIYFHSSEKVVDYLMYSMRGLKKEILTVIFLDASHAIIKSEVVAEGSLNVNTVYPRNIIKRALDFHATALVIAHNHPSGTLQPSAQDLKLTRTLFLLCSTMHINLLDHLVIGDGYFSFADNGLMKSIRDECRKVMAALKQ